MINHHQHTYCLLIALQGNYLFEIKDDMKGQMTIKKKIYTCLKPKERHWSMQKDLNSSADASVLKSLSIASVKASSYLNGS